MWWSLISYWIKKYKHYIVYAVLLAGLVYLYLSRSNIRSEAVRYKNNWHNSEASLDRVIRMGKEYVSSGVNTVKISELTDSIKNVIRNEFDLNLRNVKTIITNKLTVENQIKTTLRDTVIFDTIQAKKCDWRDNYNRFSYLQYKDSVFAEFSCSIPLTQVIHVKPTCWNPFKKVFWFAENWGKRRPLEQTITSPNNRARIDYSKVLNIE